MQTFRYANALRTPQRFCAAEYTEPWVSKYIVGKYTRHDPKNLDIGKGLIDSPEKYICFGELYEHKTATE